MNNQNENNQENESRQIEVKEYLRRLKFDEISGDPITSCIISCLLYTSPRPRDQRGWACAGYG